jgi:hypothetical protein
MKRNAVVGCIAAPGCLVAITAVTLFFVAVRSERPFPAAQVRAATRARVREGRSDDHATLRVITDPDTLRRLADVMADYDMWPHTGEPRTDCRTLLIEWERPGEKSVGVAMCVGGIGHYPENAPLARARRFDDAKRKEVLRLVGVAWPPELR